MIDIQTTGLDAALKALDSKQVERAHVRAANRAISRGRTVWNKAIREDYAIKAGDINKASRLRKLSRIAGDAGIVLSGPVMPLGYFSPRKTARGITVKIRKKDARKLVKGAFHIPTAGKHVFRRKGTERLPIDKLFTLSVPQMADDESVINATIGAIEGEYRKEFGRLIELFGERL